MGRYKVDIPDELWREARSDAVNMGITISAWVAQAIYRRLDKDKTNAKVIRELEAAREE